MHIDIPSHLGATLREVRQREYDGKPARSIVATRSYRTDRADLWDALTNPERIPRWFLPVSGDLKLGGRYQLEGNAGGVVEACDPPTHFAVTWEFAGQLSWLHVTLRAEGSESTVLELEHIEPITEAGQEYWERYGPGAGGVGWDLGLLGLGQFLVTGVPADHAAAEAWTQSEDGHRFIRGSAEAWATAAIAAGADESAARKSEARTIAFYTGQPEPE